MRSKEPDLDQPDPTEPGLPWELDAEGQAVGRADPVDTLPPVYDDHDTPVRLPPPLLAFAIAITLGMTTGGLLWIFGD